MPPRSWSTSRTDLIPDARRGVAVAGAREAPWFIGELAAWRPRAGVDCELATEPAAPYAVQLAGDPARAAEVWREIGCPYEAALALADMDDEQPLRRAHAELQALGAGPAAAIVARRLRKRGARGVPRGPRPGTRDNPAGLTARELEVLVLLADGLRNAEIAERLFPREGGRPPRLRDPAQARGDVAGPGGSQGGAARPRRPR